MKRIGFAVLIALLTAGAFGWHTDGHRLATELAVAAEAQSLPAFFVAGVRAIGQNTADPDAYRNPAAPQLRDADAPEHYTKYDVLKELNFPATRYAFIEAAAKKGHKLTDVGTCPYAVAEATQRLTMAFAEHRKWPDDPAIQLKCLVYAGLLAHFAQDLCQPLHTTFDHDDRARPDGSSPKTGIHLKTYALLAKVPVAASGPGAGLENLWPPAAPPELAALRPAPYADLMAAIFEQAKQSSALVEKVYELEKQLPEQKDQIKPGSPVMALATERLAACVHFTASLYLTAWADSAKVQLPPWLDKDRAAAVGGQVGRAQSQPATKL